MSNTPADDRLEEVWTTRGLDEETTRKTNTLTKNDRDRMEELCQHIQEHDAAGSMGIGYDRGRVKVNVSLEDQHSKQVRQDYIHNRIDARLDDVISRLNSYNWNHFTIEEMQKVMDAMNLLAEVAESFRPGTRYVGCGCGDNEACSECVEDETVTVNP